MRMSLWVGTLALAATALLNGQEPLVLVRTIALPQVEGRIDHLAVDRDLQRLYVAALENNSLEVLDLKNGTRVQSVKSLHEPQGIAVVSTSKRVVVANGQSGDVQFRDASDLHVARTISMFEDADNVRYDSAAQRVYVGYGTGALAVFDASSGRRIGNVPLAGHPESFQLETGGSRIFVNVPTAKHIAVVDRTSLKVLSTWPLVGAESNFPMALDEGDHRIFVGCRRPAKVLIYDTATGKVVGSTDVVGDTDDLFYDSARKRLYVSGGEGFIDVFRLQDPDHLNRIARMATAAGARTSLLVPDQNRLYLAVPHRGNQQAEVRVYETR